jgi:thioredoxin reductase
MAESVDVIIVGGGPAGLSAALVLGRCRRRVVVCDAGRPRNACSPHSHGYLTRDGMPPLELLALGREELRAYDVSVRDTEVTDVAGIATGVRAVLADGTSLHARKVLIATGVEDVRPKVPGCDALYGVSIHHCPYCDGWENRDRPLAIYGPPDQAAGLALSLRTWSRDLVVCTDGRQLTTAARTRLAGTDIAVRTERLTALEGTDGRLERIVFTKGPVLERQGLFFNTGQVQRSPLAERLGCTFTSKGHVRCDRKGRTGVADLFVAGAANGDVQFVIVAAAEGAKAAVAINKELQEEDGGLTAG